MTACELPSDPTHEFALIGIRFLVNLAVLAFDELEAESWSRSAPPALPPKGTMDLAATVAGDGRLEFDERGECALVIRVLRVHGASVLRFNSHHSGERDCVQRQSMTGNSHNELARVDDAMQVKARPTQVAIGRQEIIASKAPAPAKGRTPAIPSFGTNGTVFTRWRATCMG
jgi:hypothetical protein